MMKFLFTIILVCFLEPCYGQNSITEITYKQTCAKCVHFNLNIEIKSKNSEYQIKVNYVTTNIKIDTLFNITASQFDHLTKSLAKISPVDIKADQGTQGFDGGIYTIQFGNLNKQVTYSTWSPTNNMSKRKLTSFVNTCKEIIQLANLNSEHILM